MKKIFFVVSTFLFFISCKDQINLPDYNVNNYDKSKPIYLQDTIKCKVIEIVSINGKIVLSDKIRFYNRRGDIAAEITHNENDIIIRSALKIILRTDEAIEQWTEGGKFFINGDTIVTERRLRMK
jgi:hypothetical protein